MKVHRDESTSNNKVTGLRMAELCCTQRNYVIVV